MSYSTKHFGVWVLEQFGSVLLSENLISCGISQYIVYAAKSRLHRAILRMPTNSYAMSRACERSGAAKCPTHRSAPFTIVPLTAPLRRPPAPLRLHLNFLNPAHRSAPLIWLFDPLRSTGRPDLRGGEVRSPRSLTNKGPPNTPANFLSFLAGIGYMRVF